MTTEEEGCPRHEPAPAGHDHAESKPSCPWCMLDRWQFAVEARDAEIKRLRAEVERGARALIVALRPT